MIFFIKIRFCVNSTCVHPIHGRYLVITLGKVGNFSLSRKNTRLCGVMYKDKHLPDLAHIRHASTGDVKYPDADARFIGRTQIDGLSPT